MFDKKAFDNLYPYIFEKIISNIKFLSINYKILM